MTLATGKRLASAGAIEHLVGLPNATVESWPKVLQATRLLRAGTASKD